MINMPTAHFEYVCDDCDRVYLMIIRDDIDGTPVCWTCGQVGVDVFNDSVMYDWSVLDRNCAGTQCKIGRPDSNGAFTVLTAREQWHVIIRYRDGRTVGTERFPFVRLQPSMNQGSNDANMNHQVWQDGGGEAPIADEHDVILPSLELHGHLPVVDEEGAAERRTGSDGVIDLDGDGDIHDFSETD